MLNATVDVLAHVKLQNVPELCRLRKLLLNANTSDEKPVDESFAFLDDDQIAYVKKYNAEVGADSNASVQMGSHNFYSNTTGYTNFFDVYGKPEKVYTNNRAPNIITYFWQEDWEQVISGDSAIGHYVCVYFPAVGGKARSKKERAYASGVWRCGLITSYSPNAGTYLVEFDACVATLKKSDGVTEYEDEVPFEVIRLRLSSVLFYWDDLNNYYRIDQNLFGGIFNGLTRSVPDLLMKQVDIDEIEPPSVYYPCVQRPQASAYAKTGHAMPSLHHILLVNRFYAAGGFDNLITAIKKPQPVLISEPVKEAATSKSGALWGKVASSVIGEKHDPILSRITAKPPLSQEALFIHLEFIYDLREMMPAEYLHDELLMGFNHGVIANYGRYGDVQLRQFDYKFFALFLVKLNDLMRYTVLHAEAAMEEIIQSNTDISTLIYLCIAGKLLNCSMLTKHVVSIAMIKYALFCTVPDIVALLERDDRAFAPSIAPDMGASSTIPAIFEGTQFSKQMVESWVVQANIVSKLFGAGTVSYHEDIIIASKYVVLFLLLNDENEVDILSTMWSSVPSNLGHNEIVPVYEMLPEVLPHLSAQQITFVYMYVRKVPLYLYTDQLLRLLQKIAIVLPRNFKLTDEVEGAAKGILPYGLNLLWEFILDPIRSDGREDGKDTSRRSYSSDSIDLCIGLIVGIIHNPDLNSKQSERMATDFSRYHLAMVHMCVEMVKEGKSVGACLLLLKRLLISKCSLPNQNRSSKAILKWFYEFLPNSNSPIAYNYDISGACKFITAETDLSSLALDVSSVETHYQVIDMIVKHVEELDSKVYLTREANDFSASYVAEDLGDFFVQTETGISRLPYSRTVREMLDFIKFILFYSKNGDEDILETVSTQGTRELSVPAGDSSKDASYPTSPSRSNSMELTGSKPGLGPLRRTPSMTFFSDVSQTQRGSSRGMFLFESGKANGVLAVRSSGAASAAKAGSPIFLTEEHLVRLWKILYVKARCEHIRALVLQFLDDCVSMENKSVLQLLFLFSKDVYVPLAALKTVGDFNPTQIISGSSKCFERLIPKVVLSQPGKLFAVNDSVESREISIFREGVLEGFFAKQLLPLLEADDSTACISNCTPIVTSLITISLKLFFYTNLYNGSICIGGIGSDRLGVPQMPPVSGEDYVQNSGAELSVSGTCGVSFVPPPLSWSRTECEVIYVSLLWKLLAEVDSEQSSNTVTEIVELVSTLLIELYQRVPNDGVTSMMVETNTVLSVQRSFVRKCFDEISVADCCEESGSTDSSDTFRSSRRTTRYLELAHRFARRCELVAFYCMSIRFIPSRFTVPLQSGTKIVPVAKDAPLSPPVTIDGILSIFTLKMVLDMLTVRLNAYLDDDSDYSVELSLMGEKSKTLVDNSNVESGDEIVYSEYTFIRAMDEDRTVADYGLSLSNQLENRNIISFDIVAKTDADGFVSLEDRNGLISPCEKIDYKFVSSQSIWDSYNGNSVYKDDETGTIKLYNDCYYYSPWEYEERVLLNLTGHAEYRGPEPYGSARSPFHLYLFKLFTSETGERDVCANYAGNLLTMLDGDVQQLSRKMSINHAEPASSCWEALKMLPFENNDVYELLSVLDPEEKSSPLFESLRDVHSPYRLLYTIRIVHKLLTYTHPPGFVPPSTVKRRGVSVKKEIRPTLSTKVSSVFKKFGKSSSKGVKKSDDNTPNGVKWWTWDFVQMGGINTLANSVVKIADRIVSMLGRNCSDIEFAGVYTDRVMRRTDAIIQCFASLCGLLHKVLLLDLNYSMWHIAKQPYLSSDELAKSRNLIGIPSKQMLESLANVSVLLKKIVKALSTLVSCVNAEKLFSEFSLVSAIEHGLLLIFGLSMCNQTLDSSTVSNGVKNLQPHHDGLVKILCFGCITSKSENTRRKCCDLVCHICTQVRLKCCDPSVEQQCVVDMDRFLLHAGIKAIRHEHKLEQNLGVLREQGAVVRLTEFDSDLDCVLDNSGLETRGEVFFYFKHLLLLSIRASSEVQEGEERVHHSLAQVYKLITELRLQMIDFASINDAKSANIKRTTTVFESWEITSFKKSFARLLSAFRGLVDCDKYKDVTDIALCSSLVNQLSLVAGGDNYCGGTDRHLTEVSYLTHVKLHNVDSHTGISGDFEVCLISVIKFLQCVVQEASETGGDNAERIIEQIGMLSISIGDQSGSYSMLLVRYLYALCMFPAAHGGARYFSVPHLSTPNGRKRAYALFYAICRGSSVVRVEAERIMNEVHYKCKIPSEVKELNVLLQCPPRYPWQYVPTAFSRGAIKSFRVQTSLKALTTNKKNRLDVDDNTHFYSGLNNQGGTCYMNSLLQQLYHVKSFSDALMAVNLNEVSCMHQHAVVGESACSATPASTENSHVYDIQRMLMADSEYYGRENDNEKMLIQLQWLFVQLRMSPQHTVDTLPFCRSFLGYDGQPVNVAEQTDINEFAGMLFEKLELISVNKTGSEEKIYPVASILKSAFGGTLVSKVQAMNSDYTSEREEDFFILTCPVKGQDTLENALTSFVQDEKLICDNRVLDDKGKKVDAKRCTCIRKLPNTMIIQLKRFEFDLRTMTRKKVNDRLTFPRKLNMFKYTEEGMRASQCKGGGGASTAVENDEEYEYVLRGVVVHSGAIDRGHYYSYIQERIEPYMWREFNDSRVNDFHVEQHLDFECFGGSMVDPRAQHARTSTSTSPSLNKILKPHNAYLLFYDKVLIAREDPTTRGTDFDAQSKPIPMHLCKMFWKYLQIQEFIYIRDSCLFNELHVQFLFHLLKLPGVDHQRLIESDESCQVEHMTLWSHFVMDALIHSNTITCLKPFFDMLCSMLVVSDKKCEFSNVDHFANLFSISSAVAKHDWWEKIFVRPLGIVEHSPSSNVAVVDHFVNFLFVLIMSSATRLVSSADKLKSEDHVTHATGSASAPTIGSVAVSMKIEEVDDFVLGFIPPDIDAFLTDIQRAAGGNDKVTIKLTTLERYLHTLLCTLEQISVNNIWEVTLSALSGGASAKSFFNIDGLTGLVYLLEKIVTPVSLQESPAMEYVVAGTEKVTHLAVVYGLIRIGAIPRLVSWCISNSFSEYSRAMCSRSVPVTKVEQEKLDTFEISFSKVVNIIFQMLTYCQIPIPVTDANSDVDTDMDSINRHLSSNVIEFQHEVSGKSTSLDADEKVVNSEYTSILDILFPRTGTRFVAPCLSVSDLQFAINL